MNKIFLLGEISKIDEPFTTATGMLVPKFVVTTKETYRDKEGQPKEYRQFHTIVVYNKDYANRFLNDPSSLQLGQTIFVEGKLIYTKYVDKKSGENKSFVSISAMQIALLGAMEKAEMRSVEEESKDIPF